MGFTGTPRPRPRWGHATAKLDDLAIVSYRVDTAVISRHLPAGFLPEVLYFDDGTSGALVSAVVSRNRGLRFRGCPAAAISCAQISYRTYVRTDAGPGVWSFSTRVDHPLVSVPRFLWRVPWSRGRIRIEAQWTSPARWRMTADDDSGSSHCELTETSRTLDRLDGFADVDDVLRTLTHPIVGWYPRSDGGIGQYSHWHALMAPRCFRAESASFAFLERLGLIIAHAQPHSVLGQEALSVDLHTPPHRLSC